jgi:hypothetical protein
MRTIGQLLANEVAHKLTGVQKIRGWHWLNNGGRRSADEILPDGSRRSATIALKRSGASRPVPVTSYLPLA